MTSEEALEIADEAMSQPMARTYVAIAILDNYTAGMQKTQDIWMGKSNEQEKRD